MEKLDRKDIGLIMVVVGLLMMVLLTAGCTEEAKQTPEIQPISSWVLPRTVQQKAEFEKWQEAYGDKPETLTRYNEAILLQIADQHGGVINSNRVGLRMILSQADPNSLANLVVDNAREIKSLQAKNKWLATQLDDRTENIYKLQKARQTDNEAEHERMWNEIRIESSGNAELPPMTKEIMAELAVEWEIEMVDRWVVTIEQQSDYLSNRWDIKIDISDADTEEDAYFKAVEQIKATSHYFTDRPFRLLQAIKTTAPEQR